MSETSEQSEKVYNRVLKFMCDNDVTCEDAIYQCDWVIENAYEFIGELFKLIKSDLPIEDGEQEESE